MFWKKKDKVKKCHEHQKLEGLGKAVEGLCVESISDKDIDDIKTLNQMKVALKKLSHEIAVLKNTPHH